MWKTVVLILLFSCAFSLCSIERKMLIVPSVQGAELYIVKEGDTLDEIARANKMTWQELWGANKATIPNPDLIYVGQKIVIGKGTTIPIPKLTPEEKVEKLAKFMFKTSGIKYEVEANIEDNMEMYRSSLAHDGNRWMDNQRKLIEWYYASTRQHEIWTLSEAIVTLSKGDDELLYTLVGLAWQESHFINRLGKHNEVSFYQFLPSTVKGYFKLDNVGLTKALWDLRNDPIISTAFAILLVKEYNGNWTLYNSGDRYPYQIKDKIHKVRQEFRK